MNQKIKQREEKLKNKEQQLKKALDHEGALLKKKATKVGKIALATGIISILLYWVYNAFFSADEDEQVKQKKPRTPSFTQRIGGLIMPYATKLLSDYFDTENQKEERRS